MTPVQSLSYCLEVSDVIPASSFLPFDPQAYFSASPHGPGLSFCHLSPDPLPPPKEVINGNIKTVTEYKIDEEGKKFKVSWAQTFSGPVCSGNLGWGVSALRG